MDFRLVTRQLGLLLVVLSACMCLVTLVELVSWSTSQAAEQMAVRALLTSAGIGAVVGLGMWMSGRQMGERFMGRREAMLLVTLSWFLGGVLSGLPYFLWHLFGGTADAMHPFANPIDCFYESISGLTTTGATVLTHIEQLPKAILLWREMTHWLGGLGIVVLFVAVLPSLGVGGKRLFNTEAPGPEGEGVRPRIRETARMLWLIYLGLTVAQTLLLWLCGQTLFDAICNTFGTLATGGFANYDASIGHYDSWAVDLVITVFMVIAGVNFAVYYLLVKRRFREAWRDTQMRVFVIFLLVATGIIALTLWGHEITTTTGDTRTVGLFGALRYAGFQVASVNSDCGFATADYDLWGFIPKALLMVGMFFGGCVGSTSGGLKIMRVIIIWKALWYELEKTFRPTVVRTVRIGDQVVDSEQLRSALMYAVVMVMTLVAGTVVVKLFEGHATDFVSAGTANLAAFCNCGPGLGLVGPVNNYEYLADGSKLTLALMMVLGRLEIFAVAALLLPGFWRAD